jgi:PAS domain S-box-containing protein
MKNFPKLALPTYRLAVALLGLAVVILSTALAPPMNWWGLVLIPVVAFQVYYPIVLLQSHLSLMHVLALGGGLLFGPGMAGWATLAGVLLGYGLRNLLGRRLNRGNEAGARQRLAATLGEMGFVFGTQALPLAAALHTTGWENGLAGRASTPLWSGYLAPLLLFALLQSAVLLGDIVLRHSQERSTNLRRDLGYVALLEFLPLPFIIFAAMAYATNPVGTLLALLGLPSILAFILSGMSATSAELGRRLQELATINQVSQVLRSTLNLDSLLNVIHQQVTALLNVDNFYVALYNPNDQRLWYPLAVKHGQRQEWPPRPLAPERLTDRVIRDARPILISPEGTGDLNLTGLPGSIESPQAWLGVPLATSDRAIGCLALFSTDPTMRFSHADMQLLTTLSGQLSVTIENALLFDQAQRRAAQLETLNHITALITASLNTQEVLAQVCSSVAQVGGARCSAIYLLEQEKNRVFLAQTFRLSDDFAKKNEAFPLSANGRTRCLRTGQPVLAHNLETTTPDPHLVDLLRKEGLQAFGDFPLTTPDGHIGILTVYYDAPHSFRSDEVELLQTFAAQAALAVANARLYASADRALARRADQLAILEAVGRELAAAIRSARLFEIILDQALKFTSSDWGSLCLLNTQTNMLETRASRGYKSYRERFNVDEGLFNLVVGSRQVIHLHDIRKEPAYIDMTGRAAQSLLAVPLIHEERVLGVLTLESDQLNAYSENDEAFIVQLANQAAVAVVNAELYTETQRRLRELSILYLTSSQLVGNPEVESIIPTVARSLESAAPNATVGVYLWDEPTSTYVSRYATAHPTRPNCLLPVSIAEARLDTLRPAMMNTGLLRPLPEQRESDVLLGGCHDCHPVIFPLVVKRQRLGMILMHTPKDQPPKDEELQLLRAVVAQVSISMQNALLFQDVTHGRDRLEAVLNSVGEGLIMLDNSGRILLVNKPVQTITGMALPELQGRYLDDLPFEALQTLGYTRQEAQTLAQSISQGSTPNPSKTTIKVAEIKPERVLERSTSLVWGEGGRVIGWMIVLRDVTEEHQIAEARELITETLVHDLRSPMSSVLSAVDILQDNFPPEQVDELIQQALYVARSSSQRVLGLVESLLDISRLKAGRMELNIGAMDLYALVTNVLAEYTTQATDAGVTLRNDVPPDLPDVNADQGKITRVVANLVDNALKFTPSGGQVVVATQVYPNGMVALQIADNGPGIPEEFREKIFDRFTQVPGSRGRRRGSGLGLTFCRLAVEAHGGRIWIEPRPGGGSIFTLTLPLASARAN